MNITKLCLYCNKRKTINQFVKNTNRCKICQSIYGKRYRKKHKEELKTKRIKYVSENKEKVKKQTHKCYYKYREKRLKKLKEYHKKHRTKLIKYSREYYYNNIQQFKNYKKRYYKEHRKEILKKRSIYRNKNKKQISIIKYQSKKKRLKENPSYRLKEYARNRIYHVLKGINKSKNTMALMGLKNWEQLWKWLEPQFYGKMKRNNYGKMWVVHHVQECKKFDITCPKQQRKCFHYTNLQPLLIKDHKKIHQR